MDFIDWSHYVLGILEKNKLSPCLDHHEIPSVIFSDEITQRPNFRGSVIRSGLFNTLDLLTNAGLIDERKNCWSINLFGRKILSNPIPYWTAICNEELEQEEETILRLVNRLSPKTVENPFYGWLEKVGQNEIISAFNIVPPPVKTNEQQETLSKYIYDLPRLLKQRGFLSVYDLWAYQTNLKPTYQGLVWETRRGFTLESKLIDELIKEWETTNVDFKREIGLREKKHKAEFAKDILGLATTKSSGKRYMIIGFDDKTKEYYAPPDVSVTQDRMENVLSDLTDPVVTVRYEIVDYRKGKVGKLEIIRETEKLPYRAKKDVIVDEKRRKGLEKDKIYVRHGSHTEQPSKIELEALEEEGKRTRGES
jgi:hypothetical protein